MLNQLSYKVVLASLLIGISSNAAAFGDQWYLGVGGGVSRLQPNPVDPDVDRSDENGNTAVVFLGRDFDDRSSAQVQLYSLGESLFDNGESARYMAGDASVLYRFYDSRDKRPNAGLAASLYGRFGLGFIDRDSSEAISNDVPVYFGAGAGMETYFTDNLGMRLEAIFQDADTASASLSVVGRFGGRTQAAPPMIQPTFPVPENSPEANTESANPSMTLGKPSGEDLPADSSGTARPASETANAPATSGESVEDNRPEVWIGPLTQIEQVTDLPDDNVPAGSTTLPSVEIMTTPQEQSNVPSAAAKVDTDKDGIIDALDQCPESHAGYPVDETGCSMFNKIASQMTFNDNSASLTPANIRALNLLSGLLKKYPNSRVELIAHTDNQGSEENQSSLTRQRLRTMGVYLVKDGISQDRLLLRSFGAKRPAFDNTTVEGRRQNNRVEVLEYPEQPL